VFSGVSNYLALLSFYDFSIEKKLKSKTFMEIAEVVDLVAAIAATVAVVAGAYFSNPIALGIGVGMAPFSFMSWFFTAEYRKLAELDATRNTIEQSAKNVQMSVGEMRERRQILSESTEQLIRTNTLVSQGEERIGVIEAELRKVVVETKEMNRLQRKTQKQLLDTTVKLRDHVATIRPLVESLSQDLIKLEEASLEESIRFQDRIKELEERKKAIGTIGKATAKMLELKSAIADLKATNRSEFDRIVFFIPELESF
jgi:hypothetical protein